MATESPLKSLVEINAGDFKGIKLSRFQDSDMDDPLFSISVVHGLGIDGFSFQSAGELKGFLQRCIEAIEAEE